MSGTSPPTPKRVEEIVEPTPAEILIGVAGRAAAPPGLLAALTTRPVIGVPVGHTVPFDSLLTIVQMPPGITVATVGIDRGDNAALLAPGILGVKDHDNRSRLDQHRRDQEQEILAANASLRAELGLKAG